jgi:hypothetical protein
MGTVDMPGIVVIKRRYFKGCSELIVPEDYGSGRLEVLDWICWETERQSVAALRGHIWCDVTRTRMPAEEGAAAVRTKRREWLLSAVHVDWLEPQLH